MSGLLGVNGSIPLHAQQWPEIKIEAPSDVTVGGRFGAAMDLEEDLLLIGAPDVDAGALGSGAAYLFHRYEGGLNAFGLVKKLEPPFAAISAGFGTQVHLVGTMAFVSSPGDPEMGSPVGAIYTFEQDLGGPDNWGFKQRIVPDSVQWGMSFGRNFVIKDDLLFALCPGYDEDPTDTDIGLGGMAVFQRSDQGAYNELRFLGGEVFVDTAVYDYRPCVLDWFAIFQGRLVHARFGPDAYQVSAAELSVPGAMVPPAELIQLNDPFGYNPAQLRLDRGVAGENVLLLGLKHVSVDVAPWAVPFAWSGDSMAQQAGYLRADPSFPLDYFERRWNAFGLWNDQRAVVGASGDELFTPLGHVEVFDHTGIGEAGWSRVAYLVPSDPHLGDQFGTNALVGEDIVVVSAPKYGDADLGQVYVFIDPNSAVAEDDHEGPISLSIAPHPVRRGEVFRLGGIAAEKAGVVLIRTMDGRLLRHDRVAPGASIRTGELSPATYLLTWRDMYAPGPELTRPLIILP